MAKYNGMGWHNQSIRHSNARKYGKAGGKYSDDNLRLAFHTQQPMFSTRVAQLLNQGFSEKQAVKKVEDELLAGYKKWEQKDKKHFGYAKTDFESFPINKEYSIVAHHEKTSRGFRHVVSLMKNGVEVDKATTNYQNRTWERFNYESAISRLLQKTKIMNDKERKEYLDLLSKKDEEKINKQFGMIGTIAQMGEVLTSSKKESNDWKERMIKAGLPSLDIPEDWNNLSEDEKEKRLNKVIAYMKEK